jgi:hypothetical protein
MTTQLLEECAMRYRMIPLLLVLYALINSVMVVVLGRAFDWPAILDEPAAVVLPAFAAAEGTIVTGFYLLLLASVLLVPISLGLHLGGRSVAAFGVISGVVQTLGWVRWPLVVPALSDAWAAAPPDSVQRLIVAGNFDTLNSYAGGAVGEHLGWLFQALWAIGVAWWLLRGGARGERLLGGAGLVLAAVWGVAFLLPVFVPAIADGAFGTAGFTAYGLWMIWLVALAVRTWRTGLVVGSAS